MSILSTGLATLKDLFATRRLTVPQFQRAYAWEEEPHLRNFIEDLSTHPIGPDRTYFLGTILLSTAPEFDTPLLGGFAVVDGQQRLTTVSILATAAIQRLSAENGDIGLAEEYVDLFIRTRRGTRKVHTILEDDPFFERFIIGNQIASGSDCDTPSQHRLLSAKRYFSKRLESLPANELKQLLATLCGSQILVYAVNSNSEATQIFELQNDRGKRLTDLEALKSYLMHGLYLHGKVNTEPDLKVVQQNFAAIYRAAEKAATKYDATLDSA